MAQRQWHQHQQQERLLVMSVLVLVSGLVIVVSWWVGIEEQLNGPTDGEQVSNQHIQM